MTEIKKIATRDGFLFIEVTDTDLEIDDSKLQAPLGGLRPDDRPEDGELVGFHGDALRTFDILKDSIGELTDAVSSAMRDKGPQEWSLAFSVGFKGKLSPIPVILSSEGNAALKITATWRKS